MGDWLEPLLRLLQYAALLGLFGWAAFRLTGLRRLDSFLGEGSGRLALPAAVAAPLLSIMLMLTSIAAMMGQPVSVLDWPMVSAMITDTSIGWAFIARFAMLLMGLIALLLQHRSRNALWAASLFYAAALMTLGWSGHAAATEGGLGLFHRINNGVHLIAAGLWLGAIGWLWALTLRASREPSGDFAPTLLGVMHRFAPLGVTLVAVVTLTGVLNAQLIFGLGNIAAVATTGYGMLLAVKVVLVLGMLGFGAHNAMAGRRYADAVTEEPVSPDATVSTLRRSLAGELGFGIGVVGLVAVLGMLSPIMM